LVVQWLDIGCAIKVIGSAPRCSISCNSCCYQAPQIWQWSTQTE